MSCYEVRYEGKSHRTSLRPRQKAPGHDASRGISTVCLKSVQPHPSGHTYISSKLSEEKQQTLYPARESSTRYGSDKELHRMPEPSESQ